MCKANFIPNSEFGTKPGFSGHGPSGSVICRLRGKNQIPATDIAKTEAFYEQAFGWKFTDYGPDYTSFEDGRIAGGFTKEGKVGRGGPLVVLYASDLAATEKKVRDAGGVIVKDAFPFPGGRRFHVADPSGNELAVWSER